MIEPLPGFPVGVLGFRFSGHVSRDEYSQVLARALRSGSRAGTVLDTGSRRS